MQLTAYAGRRIFSAMNAFAGVAEPVRRQILDCLLEGEWPVNELVDRLGVSQPTVSKHLRGLRGAGLVVARGGAPHRRYRIEPEALAEIDAWLAPYRRLWTRRLDALENFLDRRETP